MEIKTLDYDFSICKVKDFSPADLNAEFAFAAKTDEEKSLVCLTQKAPPDALAQDDGWKAFCINGMLDFSLIGIIAEISKLLAENKIGIFVISTYNTDYVLVKKESYQSALDILKTNGYKIILA